MKLIDPLRDTWTPVELIDLKALPSTPTLLTLPQWHTVSDAWPAAVPVGLRLDNDADVSHLLFGEARRFALIALHFPKWTDGRAYTQARLLRARGRYVGELRATGDVVVDMLPLLERTGFDAAQLRNASSGAQTVVDEVLGAFSSHYQGDVNEPRAAHARGDASSSSVSRSPQRAA
jgi:uncharacterized protein (DUF934 family)